MSTRENIRLIARAPLATSSPIFEKIQVLYFMRIVCQQTILMKYHALLLFLKKRQNLKLSSAANNIGGALRVKYT